MDKTRITIDLATEPLVLKGIKDRAKKEKRSLNKQVLFEVLPTLRKLNKKGKA